MPRITVQPWMYKEFKLIYPKQYRIHSKLAFQRFKEWLAKEYPDLRIGETYQITYDTYIQHIDKYK